MVPASRHASHPAASGSCKQATLLFRLACKNARGTTLQHKISQASRFSNVQCRPLRAPRTQGELFANLDSTPSYLASCSHRRTRRCRSFNSLYKPRANDMSTKPVLICCYFFLSSKGKHSNGFNSYICVYVCVCVCQSVTPSNLSVLQGEWMNE